MAGDISPSPLSLFWPFSLHGWEQKMTAVEPVFIRKKMKALLAKAKSIYLDLTAFKPYRENHNTGPMPKQKPGVFSGTGIRIAVMLPGRGRIFRGVEANFFNLAKQLSRHYAVTV